MKKRIAIFFGGNYPETGPAGVARIQDMFKYIEKYEKHLISPGKESLEKDEFFDKIFISGRHRAGISITSLLTNLIFVVRAIFRFLLNNRKFDYEVIYATSPPFFPVLAASFCSMLTGTPLIFDVRDPWALNLTDFGLERASLPFRIASILEKFGHTTATQVAVVSPGLSKLVQEEFGVSEDKIFLLLNAADTEVFKPQEKKAAREKLDMPKDKTILLFQGSFGPYHYLEKLTSVFADYLGASGEEDTCMMLVGGEREELRKKKKELGDHLILEGRVPRKQIPYYISGADIGIVPLEPREISEIALPVKLYEYAACGKPVLLFGRSKESEYIIKKYDIGRVVSSEDVEQFKKAVDELMCEHEKFSKNAREMTEEINRESSAEVLEGMIHRCIVGEDIESYKGDLESF